MGREYLVKATQSAYTDDGPVMIETTMITEAEGDLEACQKLYKRLDKSIILVSNFAIPTKTIKMEEEAR